MSGEKTPLLSGSIPSFEIFMTSWEQLQLEHQHLKKFIEVGLWSAYQYYAKMDRTSSYIVAMCTCVDRDVLETALIVF